MTDNSTDSLTEDTPVQDPFSPENIGIIQFIMLGRIYDVLMLQLQLTDPAACAKLQEIHTSGALVGTSPNFNGQFLSDEP